MKKSSEPRIRIGDVERGLAEQALWEHQYAGRFKPGEHEERCARVTAATTRAELEELFTDLPAPHPDLSGVVRPDESDTEEVVSIGGAYAGLGLIVLVLGIPAAIILTILYGMWWTFFPVVGLTMAIWVLGYMAEVREKRLEDTVR